ncbi:serine hydrolase [soil metagenome]
MRKQISDIANEGGALSVGVAYHDYETRSGWSYHGEKWYHAASTIKVPVLVGLYGEIARGELREYSRVHVRNRFCSAAGGTPFRVESGRDANAEVHASIGKTMRVNELAKHMIVTSSNLATNLLIDLVGVEKIQQSLSEMGVEGIELKRGVEDEKAFAAEMNNRVTALGLLGVLRVIEERRAFSDEASAAMLEILHQQQFRSGIPAGLPSDARVANKTGEISTVAHDVGLVYLPDRKPYALAILTEWDASDTSGRRETLAEISRAVYRHLTEAE